MLELIQNLSLNLMHSKYDARLLAWDGDINPCPWQRCSVIFNRRTGRFWIKAGDFWAVGQAPPAMVQRFALHAALTMAKSDLPPTSLIGVRSDVDEVFYRSKNFGDPNN